MVLKVPLNTGINRIRLEFKGEMSSSMKAFLDRVSINRIRLEFKEERPSDARYDKEHVLIESDWNLKTWTRLSLIVVQKGINRIRLEFKGDISVKKMYSNDSINRIRLEFKGFSVSRWRWRRFRVLIESDWNLKEDIR